LPVAPIQCFHDKQFPSKAMFLHLTCSRSMRGRQAISCCSRSRCVFPSHRSPNHLRLQLQLSPQLEYSISACKYIRAAVAAEQLDCAVVMKCGRAGSLGWIVESTAPEQRLRQRQPKNIRIYRTVAAPSSAHTVRLAVELEYLDQMRGRSIRLRIRD
jgi:hypothetical protein